jgi:hypothetical protein
MTVKQLRNIGCKVKIQHYRFVSYNAFHLTGKKGYLIGKLLPEKDVDGKERFPRGGKTTMEVTTPQGRTFITETNCSKSDGFCRRRGVQICLERLQLEILKTLADL